jgi:hypothetical protein
MGGSALPICELWPGPRVPCVARLPASPARGPVAAYARSYVNVSPSACALAHKRYTHITAAAAAPARFLAQLPTYQARCQS